MGQSIQALLVKREHEAVACYFILLEIMSLFEDPEQRGILKINKRHLARKWHVTLPRSERIVRMLCSCCDQLVITTCAEDYQVEVLNWSEMQEKRGKFKRKSLTEEEVRIKKENKNPQTPTGGYPVVDSKRKASTKGGGKLLPRFLLTSTKKKGASRSRAQARSPPALLTA